MTRRISESEKQNLSLKKFRLISHEELPTSNNNFNVQSRITFDSPRINSNNHSQNKSRENINNNYHNQNSKSPAMFRFDEDILTLRENVRESINYMDTFEMLNSYEKSRVSLGIAEP